MNTERRYELLGKIDSKDVERRSGALMALRFLQLIESKGLKAEYPTYSEDEHGMYDITYTLSDGSEVSMCYTHSYTLYQETAHYMMLFK